MSFFTAVNNINEIWLTSIVLGLWHKFKTRLTEQIKLSACLDKDKWEDTISVIKIKKNFLKREFNLVKLIYLKTLNHPITCEIWVCVRPHIHAPVSDQQQDYVKAWIGSVF